MQLDLLDLIVHRVDEAIIAQRSTDGFVNATAMCAAAGKSWASYVRNKEAHEFLAELSAQMGVQRTELAIVTRGGLPHQQGTWVHPDIAIHLAQWLSPRFAVAVSRWVREWISGKAKPAPMPPHVARYMLNQDQVPATHFSMLNEMVFAFIAPLENVGYTVPDKMIPDISSGRMFCEWLRKKGVNTDVFETYHHKFTDGRVVPAKLYPVELLSDFRMWFNNVWLPQRAPVYFGDRDPKALPFLQRAHPKALFAAPPKRRLVLPPASPGPKKRAP